MITTERMQQMVKDISLGQNPFPHNEEEAVFVEIIEKELEEILEKKMEILIPSEWEVEV
jgi:hypothetical protein